MRSFLGFNCYYVFVQVGFRLFLKKSGHVIHPSVLDSFMPTCHKLAPSETEENLEKKCLNKINGEGLAHCGWCYPWAVSLRSYKKAG